MSERDGALASSVYDDWGRDPNAPVLTRLAALGISGYLRIVYATARLKCLQPDIHESVLRSPGGTYIGVLWHKHVGLTTPFYSNVPLVLLVSRSKDGELFVRIMTHFEKRTIRGSSSRTDGRDRGGASALRQLAHAADAGYHLAITPDGPKGPPERIKPGVIQLGAMTGRPIVPLGVAVSRFIRISTWDRTLIPLPFTQIVISYGEFLSVPRTSDSDELESYRKELERRLQAANAHAQASLQAAAD